MRSGESVAIWECQRISSNASHFLGPDLQCGFWAK